MKTKDQKSEQPFWMDMPSGYTKGVRQKTALYRVAEMMKYLISISSLMAVLILFYTLSNTSILFWLVLVYIFIAAMSTIHASLRKKTRRSQVETIQQKARETTGASVIDSAVHVAGHPLLDRDQPVVLALVSDNLHIYSYSDSSPVSRIPLDEVSSVKTIVYDTDRIPHAEIIDSTAQALEIKFKRQDIEWKALFRKMLRVRPIDWFHYIQRAQLVDQ